jgi:hypothetical protein
MSPTTRVHPRLMSPRLIPLVCGENVVADARVYPGFPPLNLHGKEGDRPFALFGSSRRTLPAAAVCDWRTYWRTKHELPAKGLFQGGLENRYPS